MSDDEKPTTGIIDPETGKAHPNSGPESGPDGGEGTVARDVANEGTDGTEDEDTPDADGLTEKGVGTDNSPEDTPPAW